MIDTRILCGVLLFAASCWSSSPTSPSTARASDVMEQVWSVSRADDGTCLAVAHCEEVKPGVACNAKPPVGAVRFSPTACIADAKTWSIGRRGDTCSVLAVECTDGERCDRPHDVACPPAVAESPRIPVELATSASLNMERGRAAQAAGDHDAARQYFEFVISRFPYSKYAVEAKRALAGSPAPTL